MSKGLPASFVLVTIPLTAVLVKLIGLVRRHLWE